MLLWYFARLALQGKAGHRPNSEPAFCCAAASIVPPGLRELATALNEWLKAADFRTEDRPFAAHVTLLRHARCDKALPEGGLRIEWPVRDFVLVESELRPEGAGYRILQRWPLGQT